MLKGASILDINNLSAITEAHASPKFITFDVQAGGSHCTLLNSCDRLTEQHNLEPSRSPFAVPTYLLLTMLLPIYLRDIIEAKPLALRRAYVFDPHDVTSIIISHKASELLLPMKYHHEEPTSRLLCTKQHRPQD